MELSEEHLMLRDTVRAFTEKEIMPIADKLDREDRFPVELFKKFAKLGILGVITPEKYGGVGSDIMASVIILEELGKGSVAVAGSYEELASVAIYQHGTETQRQKYLPPFFTGDCIGAFGLTEPGAGSDSVAIQTSALRSGDYYIINGNKIFITNGSIAHVFLIIAKTDKNKGAHGISAFIVEKESKGFSVSRELEKYGVRGSPTCELALEDVKVSAENLLGRENEGVSVMMALLDLDRTCFAAIGLGNAEAAFAASLKYSKEREQFGKPISSFQLIKAKLADMYTNIEAARLLIYDTANMIDAGQKARKKAAATLLFTGEMGMKVCLEAVQIHGGYGYMMEFPVNRYFRDAKLFEIGAGTAEIRRLLIARELLEE